MCITMLFFYFIVLEPKIVLLKVLLFDDVTSGSLGGNNDVRRSAVVQGRLKSTRQWRSLLLSRQEQLSRQLKFISTFACLAAYCSR